MSHSFHAVDLGAKFGLSPMAALAAWQYRRGHATVDAQPTRTATLGRLSKVEEVFSSNQHF
jgi:hypothetical protein